MRKIYPNGLVQTIARNGTPGYSDGDGATARFSFPNGIALHPDGSLIVADGGNNRIRRVNLNPGVTNAPPKAALLVMEMNPSLTIYGSTDRKSVV